MNSTEEISKYRESTEHYYSPTLSRRLLGYGYDLPEKSPKKDKKWSIGSLFRRKKKDGSDSSSEDDSQKKGFLKRRKKPDKKKKNSKAIGTFDHVVLSRNSHFFSNGYEDPGIFSDPTNGMPKALGKEPVPKSNTPQSLDDVTVTSSRSSLVAPSSDGAQRKPRKVLSKFRAEARRLNLKHDTSSDEDSHCSVSSSRFRSDESLGPTHKKSRAARTERYLKRHSKDGEVSSDFLRLSKSDADDNNRSPSRSPLVPKSNNLYSNLSESPNISGLSTIPPSHGNHNRIRVSNSTSNPSYKPPLSMNEYNYSTMKSSHEYLDSQRSVSYDANIHKSVVEPVIHVQFPLGRPKFRNLSLVDGRNVQARQPPPPPPRDPRRLVTAQYYENVRPSTFYFDGSGQMRSKSFNTPSSPPQHKFTSFNLHLNARSTSEDHLPKNNIQLVPRPSSATPDASKFVQRPDFKSNSENYNYLTDKKPRSRKPIFIKPSADSVVLPDKSGTQRALDFWKKKDRDNNYQRKTETQSPQMFTCQTHVQTQVFLPSVLQNDIHSDKLGNSRDSLMVDEHPPPSPFKPIEHVPTPTNTEEEELKRKSSNLEEALDELEAIYNSLRLGDEDLLERAEQREKDAAAKKLLEQNKDIYPNWNMSRGALSDSSFSYEPFESVDSPRRKRLFRKSQTIDRRADDMAFRKLNKERAATINDPQSLLAKVCYLHASPVHGHDNDEVPNKNSKEPDITLDDVVYRNVKFANNSPKVVESQPPFGIPLGPITHAPNSDYLHAVPANIHRPAFKPRKIPDLVKDDLAFRNLRKDQTKEPLLSPEDLKNNNATEKKIDLNCLKKKRAVRSLSANIGSLMNHRCNNNESKTLTDIADAMEIARQVLREKDYKITATRKAFLSDSENNGNGDNLAESRMNFLNSLKVGDASYLEAKPPRGLTPDRKCSRSPKESTPIPISPLERKTESRNSSLDDLLTALATEARETNERITSELKTFVQTPNLNKALSAIDAVSEQAKLCEKLLEGVVDSTDLMVSAPKPSLEEVEQINQDSVVVESLANVVLTRDDLKIVQKPPEKVCDSDHDYENLNSDKELTLDEEEKFSEKCTSPFEERKAELIATFQELKKNVDHDLPKKNDELLPKQETETGEACVFPPPSAQECACVTYISNCDITIATNQSDVDSTSGCCSYSDGASHTQLDSLESLKSPKLVLESAKLVKVDTHKQILENQSMILRESSRNIAGSSMENGEIDGHILDEKPSPVWYRDPTTMAVACSYGIACAHQLASLDFVAILGFLFAVLSFIAALLF